MLTVVVPAETFVVPFAGTVDATVSGADVPSVCCAKPGPAAIMMRNMIVTILIGISMQIVSVFAPTRSMTTEASSGAPTRQGFYLLDMISSVSLATMKSSERMKGELTRDPALVLIIAGNHRPPS